MRDKYHRDAPQRFNLSNNPDGPLSGNDRREFSCTLSGIGPGLFPARIFLYVGRAVGKRELPARR
jgi:hypothetical protein